MFNKPLKLTSGGDGSNAKANSRRSLVPIRWADENLRILSDVSNGEQELGGARSGSRRWREVAREEAIALQRARHEQPVEDAP